jgi:hypothetical protein
LLREVEGSFPDIAKISGAFVGVTSYYLSNVSAFEYFGEVFDFLLLTLLFEYKFLIICQESNTIQVLVGYFVDLIYNRLATTLVFGRALKA